MKICYMLATSDLEGAARSLLDLIDSNNMYKIESYAIIPRKNETLEKKLIEKKVKYKYILSCTENDVGKIKNLIKKIINYLAKFRIKKYLKKNKIELLHNNSSIILVGVESAFELKIPYVCHLREKIKEDLGIEMLNEAKLNFYLNNSKANIAISKCIDEYYYKKDIKNIIHIYDGVQIKNYLIKDKKIFNNDSYNILLAGRIVETKGQLEAVKAINEIVKKDGNIKVKLFLVGNISDEEYYKNMLTYIEKNNLNDYIEIKKFEENLMKFRKNIDICLTCSTNEALGRVTIEGMLAGEIVIGANVAGTAELITNEENGLLYECGNPTDLANKILYVIKEQEMAKEIAKRGQNFALNNFDTRIQGNIVKELYEKILGGKKNEH